MLKTVTLHGQRHYVIYFTLQIINDIDILLCVLNMKLLHAYTHVVSVASKFVRNPLPFFQRFIDVNVNCFDFSHNSFTQSCETNAMTENHFTLERTEYKRIHKYETNE